MNRTNMLSHGLVQSILSFLFLLFIGCETTPKVVPENPFGKVPAIGIIESTDSKTGVTKLTTRSYAETAAKGVGDEGSGTTDPSQIAAEVGEYFVTFDVNDSVGILLEIPNGKTHSGSDLWIFKNGKTRLTKTGYYHNRPSFSDDGNYVIFSSRKGKNVITNYAEDSYIWRMRSNAAGGMTRIGSPAFEYYYPSYSPDQSKVLCDVKSLRGEDISIWYMEANGVLPSQLTKGEYPRWLNDDTISFCAKDEITGRYGVWSCGIDGSMLTQLVVDSEFDCIMPSPHPHGKFIAFVKQKPLSEIKLTSKELSGKSAETVALIKEAKRDQTRDIFVYDINSGLVKQITTNASRDDMPRWSDDGNYIYFRSTRGLNWNVWRVPFRGFSE